MGTGRQTFAYDAMRRQSLSVDVQGNRTSYTYRTEGQVLTVQNPHGARTSYSYDDAGRKVQQKRANGTWTSYTYDAASQNTQVSHYKSDNSLIDRFSWCPSSNLGAHVL